MTRPISEQLFESFCESAGFPCIRLEESTEPGVRTPDFLWTLGDVQITVEVKQFDPNDDEIVAAAKLAVGEIVTFGGTPGHRLRGILSTAASQLKSRTKLATPGLLMLYDNTGPLGGHLDSYHIKTAMYGLEQVVFRQTPDGPTLSKCEDIRFGPKRKVSPDRNRALSAVGRLQQYGDRLYVDIFHNCFAAVPLEASLLRTAGVRHFRLAEKVPGEGQEWEEL